MKSKYWFDPEKVSMRKATAAALEKAGSNIATVKENLQTSLNTESSSLVNEESGEAEVSRIIRRTVETTTAGLLNPDEQGALIEDCVQAVLACQTEYAVPAIPAAAVAHT